MTDVRWNARISRGRLASYGAFLCVIICITGTPACESREATASSKGPQRPLPAIGAVPVFDLGLTVEEAYAAIPHRRTVAQLTESGMPKADKDYFEVVFRAIDQAIVLKVAALRSFSQGRSGGQSAIRGMGEIVEFLARVDPPPALESYHKRVQQAVSDQRAFFEEWRTAGSGFQYGRSDTMASHPKVASSSVALREAYGILMRAYPRENAHNQTAFFDYLCALDFL